MDRLLFARFASRLILKIAIERGEAIKLTGVSLNAANCFFD
jgi:hypothetical protein